MAIPGLSEIESILRGNRHLILYGVRREFEFVSVKDSIFSWFLDIAGHMAWGTDDSILNEALMVTPSQVFNL